jgi:hypothetical protein
MNKQEAIEKIEKEVERCLLNDYGDFHPKTPFR